MIDIGTSSSPADPEEDLEGATGPELVAAFFRAGKAGDYEEAYACLAELLEHKGGDAHLSIVLK